MLSIYTTDKVVDVKSRFNKVYPLLKLEFYSDGHMIFGGNARKDQIPDMTLLRTINPNIKDSEIAIYETKSVHDVERDFKTICGLNVQIFRKSGEQWLQTTSTDNNFFHSIQAS